MIKIGFLWALLMAGFVSTQAQQLLTGTGYGSMAGKGDGWGDSQPVLAFNGIATMGNQVDFNTGDASNMPWIGLALAAPAQITKIRVLPRQEYAVSGSGDTTWSSWMYQYLEGAKFQASQDSLFTNPVDLATVGTVTNSYWQEFAISNLNSYKYVRLLNTKTFITFTQLQFYGISSAAPATGKTIYIPNEWKIAANNIQWDSTNRMKQSPNCVVFWGPLAGNDPTQATNTALRFEPQKILDSMEAVYDFLMDSMKIIPDAGQWAKYKLIIVMNNTWRDGLYTGWAYGGNYENQAPAMWVDPGVFKDNAWTATHEFTHTIQSMITVMYPGHGYTNTNSGFFWETHANFMAFQRYPTFATAADMPRAINLSSYFLGSGRKHYAQFYFLQQFKDDYGIDFVSRLWREANATAAETPLEVAKRLLGMDQTAFSDYMMRYAAKSVKWDFSNKNYLVASEKSLDRVWKFRKTVLLDSLGEGHFAIPDNQAPQQFGFNIVRLYPQAEDGCQQPYVYMKFKGHVDANASSGWRYAFVTVDSTTGNSVFSDFYKEDAAEIIYKLPANTSETYLVVMGAPTQMHFQKSTLFEPGFPKIYRYAWDIQLQGAVPQGYEKGFRSADTTGLTGARHANGGGWVASTAKVDATSYVAPGAFVLDRARVTGNARVEGRAEVRDDVTLSGNAVVKDFAIVGGNSAISGKAVIGGAATVYYSKVSDSASVSEGAFLQYNNLSGGAKVYGNAFSTGSTSLSGNIKIGGDAEIGGTCAKGTYLQCLGITDGTNTRTECDGLDNSPVNTDVNQAYTAFDDATMSFAKVVACGDSVGKASLPPVIILDTNSITVQLPVNSVSLHAVASDPDGTVVAYSWKKVSGPDSYAFAAATEAGTTVTGLVYGTYVFALTATDNTGTKSTARITVYVLQPNDAPVVAVDSGITVTLPVNYLTLWATASDADGYIDSVRWYRVAGDARCYIVTPGSLSTTVRNLQEGVYRFALRATDNKQKAAEDSIKVTVLPAVATSTEEGNYTTLHVSPNPASGIVHLTFPVVTGGNILIYDSKGSTVFTKALAAGAVSEEVNVSALHAGMYYVQVVTRNSNKYTASMVVVR
ncbi:Por secretion system C-terminal sorting domain-containing protein [Filimonas lacunae]|uniref:Por secretion system C-terminal sorting domain-containing protein n=1 Tax=Filimonas lacunae TaxID=477680 RepID=A0A173MDM8_9BACT|nr:DUF6055 domain-containing protein [Filimonas lacunae]BAV05551.1 avirulence protein [Filimonas lacunae]SIT20434.1 Por secretion system C-terminal sorting domain-containing protein [Filimonas lacunae]